MVRKGWPLGDSLAWTRLLEALGVRVPAGPTDQPHILPEIVPTVEMVRYPVAEFGIVQEIISITGSGSFYMTVPADEDWVVHGIFFYDGSGTWTMNVFELGDATGRDFDLESFTAAKFGQFLPPEGIPAPHGFRVGTYCNSHSSTGNMVLRVMRTRYRRVTVPV